LNRLFICAICAVTKKPLPRTLAKFAQSTASTETDHPYETLNQKGGNLTGRPI